jgi:adenylate cyclase
VASEQVGRKLTTILAADVAGYSRLAATDEERTLARLRALRSDLIDPAIAVHHGRVVKRTGDGILIEFRSVVEAVRCSIEVQNGMVERNAGLPPERQILFRCGIHLGDVVEESDGDLMGDGVNIAARLENICAPGAICLSEQAYWQVKARLDLAVSDLGNKELKNIPEPVHVFSLEVGKPAQAKPTKPPARRSVPVTWVLAAAIVLLIVAGGAWFAIKPPPATQGVATLPRTAGEGREGAAAGENTRHLSIVVLPFANLSNDPSQDYFADGITDNLTTDLSRIRNSFVIARNTAFTYKGKNEDAKEIGKELGVRYVLEGSVQRDGNRVRVNAQLIDAESGAHLWADRFEEDLSDLFKLQDDIVARLANSMRVELVKAESQHPGPRNPDSIDLTLRGLALYRGPATKENNAAMHKLFDAAIQIDPNNDDALAGSAAAYQRDYVYAWTGTKVDYDALIVGQADRALSINPSNALAPYAKAIYLSQVGRTSEALAVADAALANNANYAPIYVMHAVVSFAAGHYAQGRSDMASAMKLSPRDPQLGLWQGILGVAELALGQYDMAVVDARKAIETGNRNYRDYIFLAAALALAGNRDDAAAAMAEARRLNPALTIKWLATNAKSMIVTHMVEGLRKAGLPEDDGPRLSIVVLPFANLSGDEKQDYIADVLTDELTTYISRIPDSFVIARNTAFTYKGKPTNVKEIGKDLGVHYALEGSVQPTDKRIRTNAQLIDTETGAHLWAEEFDTDKTDLLQTEDEIVTRLARTLQLQLTEIEAARLAQTHPANSEAQELALRCEAGVNNSGSIYGGKDTEAGFALCDKALEADPKNALALAVLSVKFGARVQGYMSADRDGDLARSEDMAARALAIDPNNAYAFVGRAYALVARGRFEQAGIAAGHALTLAPSLIDAYPIQILVAIYTGDAEKAIATADKAMRLSPNDPTLFNFVSLKALGQFMLHEDEKAIDLFRRSNALNPSPSPNYLYMTAALALSGHETEAQETLKQYLAIPSVRTRSIVAWKARTFSTNPIYVAMRERAYEGLRKAGMPEQ